MMKESLSTALMVLVSPPPPDLLSRIDLDELMKKDEPPFSFPKTLEEFQYAFNEGELRLLNCLFPSGGSRVGCT